MEPSTGILTVDLAAVQENWRRVNRELSGQTTAAAVIKANAYGLGAVHVGPALYAAGCREFFVATLEEALGARTYLPESAVIYVLGGVRPGAEEIFIERAITPVLFTLADIERWRQICAQRSMRPACALKVDTGMSRLGLGAAEFIALCSNPEGFKHLRVSLVMSHLACADEPESPRNKEQLKLFRQLVDTAEKCLPDSRFSLANSSGIYLGADWHFDLVRPGASLYGINPRPGTPSPLCPVIKLQLPILQIRDIAQAVGVGYGATATLSPPARLLVVAGGYADGLHRTIGCRGVGELGGQRLPVVGRISMDTTVFDASLLQEEFAIQSVMLEVCNDSLTVDYLAERSGALGYEVLTSLGARYQRRYLSPLTTPEV